jgi:hypothetical protein
MYIFTGMDTNKGRPPKRPEDRKTAAMLIPMTDAEKQQIQAAAEGDGEKPVTWAREILLRAAKRRGKT